MTSRPHVVLHLPPQTESYTPPPPTLRDRKILGIARPVSLPPVSLGDIVPDEFDHWYARAVRPADEFA